MRKLSNSIIVYGEFKSGKLKYNNRYQLKYPDTGDYYLGLLEGEKRHGYGRYFYLNGDKYEGQWVRNKREGKGTLTFQ